jgi:hypothetical protein
MMAPRWSLERPGPKADPSTTRKYLRRPTLLAKQTCISSPEINIEASYWDQSLIVVRCKLINPHTLKAKYLGTDAGIGLAPHMSVEGLRYRRIFPQALRNQNLT